LLVPLLASAYGFCQVAVKTEDGYFLGFPSYWNLVAFYLYLLHTYVQPLPGALSLGILVGLALLTFVPTRYLYLSQKGRLNQFTTFLGGLWAVMVVIILYRLPVENQDADRLTRWLIAGSLAFPVYYLVASWLRHYWLWQVRLPKRSSPPRQQET
jgi:phosphatidylcholine synthase